MLFPLPWNFGAFFARLGETDGNRLLAAGYFLAGAAGFQSLFLSLVQCTFNTFLRGFSILWHLHLQRVSYAPEPRPGSMPLDPA